MFSGIAKQGKSKAEAPGGHLVISWENVPRK